MNKTNPILPLDHWGLDAMSFMAPYLFCAESSVKISTKGITEAGWEVLKEAIPHYANVQIMITGYLRPNFEIGGEIRTKMTTSESLIIIIDDKFALVSSFIITPEELRNSIVAISAIINEDRVREYAQIFDRRFVQSIKN